MPRLPGTSTRCRSYELNANLQKAIASEQADEIRRVAEQIAKKGEVLGPRGAKKTMLAQQVLSELEGGGRVSKKTMLAVDDAARDTDDNFGLSTAAPATTP